ncbi:MAG: hypothetical protein WBY94_11420, partial [Polyangiaceae bacterium]
AKQRAMVVASGAMAASGLATAGAAAEGAAAATKIGSIAAAKWIAVLGVASAGGLTGAAVLHRVNEQASASAVEAANAVPARAVAQKQTSAPAARKGDPPSPVVLIAPPALPPLVDPSNVRLGGAAAIATPSNEGPAREPARPASHIESATSRPSEAVATAPTEDKHPFNPLPVVLAVPAAPAEPPLPIGSRLHAELETIDQARAALNSRDTRRALDLLDHYEARFPRGEMAPEAAVLRVEVLVKSGDRLGAKRVADAFLTSNPKSPYAPRIQWLLSKSNP